MESGICIIVERTEIIQEKKAKKFLQVAPNCAAFNDWVLLMVVLFATTKSG